MHCTFGFIQTNHFGNVYTCRILYQSFPDQSRLTFFGDHLQGKSNKNVDYIIIHNCITYKVPKGLTNFFPNLKIMLIQNSNLQELRREDFDEYKNLKVFACVENPISFLPGNLFNDLKEIKSVVFIKNQLKVIEPNILDGLTKLTNVSFAVEPNFDICYSIYDPAQFRLDDVKHYLNQKFFSNYVMWMREENCKLKQECCKLQQENWMLRMENGVLNSEKMKVNSSPDNGLYADFKKYIEDENSKDLKIIIDDREFRAHKFVLAIRSPTLAKKIQERPEADSLNLVDISVGMFARILKYLYTNEVPQDVNLLFLYAAAGRLQIKNLKDYAATKIMDWVNIGNALEIFELSCKYEHNQLKKKAYAEIKKKYPSINFRDEWLVQSEKLGKTIEGLKKQEAEMKNFER